MRYSLNNKVYRYNTFYLDIFSPFFSFPINNQEGSTINTTPVLEVVSDVMQTKQPPHEDPSLPVSFPLVPLNLIKTNLRQP